MNDSIGKYIQKWLRSKEISNKEAGNAVGLSESAFEKVLTKDDILISRLLKLTALTNQNLLEYYYKEKPLNTFREKELEEWSKSIDSLNKEIESKNFLLKKNEELLMLQRKYIKELEEKIQRKE